MEDLLDPLPQDPGDHRLRDPVGHGRHAQDPRAAAVRLLDLYRTHRGREVAPRGHPVPDLVQVSPQILLELLDRDPVRTRRALVGLHLLIRLPDSPLRNAERLAWGFQLVHATPPGHLAQLIERTTATDDPAPSLRSHYRSFTATTSRSAGASRDGTPSLAVSAARETPSRHPAGAAVSGRAFSRSTRKQQIRLASSICRTPPGQ